MHLVTGLFAGALTHQKVSEEEIEQLKGGDVLETAFTQFSEEARELSVPLIDERDQFMAANILQALQEHEGKNLLAVVGAGHVKGMSNHLEKRDFDAPAVIRELNTVSQRKSWLKVIPWVIVVLIAVGFTSALQESPQLDGICLAVGHYQWQPCRHWVRPLAAAHRDVGVALSQRPLLLNRRSARQW